MLPAVASRARTSLSTLGLLAGAAGTIVAALLLHGQSRPACVADDTADDGMRLEARLASQKILPGAASHEVAVMIQAPGDFHPHARPPLSVAIVIDRSGSMTHEPLANAKSAAARLVAQLDDRDAFSVVTFSSGDETVIPMTRASAAARAAAVDQIDTIVADGGTCISCGLQRGSRELAGTPVAGGLRRMVLLSDGQANEGVFDRDELAQLAADTAANGVSISAVGVGLDFDEVTMVRLANVGRGNYYFVEDTGQLDAMFARELGMLADTIASEVRLVLADGPGARIEEVYGYPMTRTGDRVIVPIADLRVGESRKVVVRVAFAGAHTGPLAFTHVELDWRRVADRADRRATATACVDVTDDAQAVARSVDPAVAHVIEQALSARAIDEASVVYESHGSAAAEQVLELRGALLHANTHLDPVLRRQLEVDNAMALDNLRASPAARAKKVNGVMSYRLAH